MSGPFECPDWMLQDPRTKEEYDRYMRMRISLDGGQTWFPVYDLGYVAERPAEFYYQLTEISAKIWQLATDPLGFWVPLDPRWRRDENRSPYRYNDEYRGEPEMWAPVPWNAFQEDGVAR